jgi:2-polyprenyl-3-methyl-5-hydroxy-6-metoxy-1,4-benzoquinol methylase
MRRPTRSSWDVRQRDYFESAQHQYPREALVDPPLRTRLEHAYIESAVAKARGGHGPVVDFGAGTGRLTIGLARAGYNVIAVDRSRSSLDVLEGVARQLGLERVETRTDLPTAGVSAVVGCDVLHHIDMSEWLPRLRDVLPRDGKAIFSEPGALNPAWYVYLAACYDIRAETRIVTCNLRTLRRCFARSGFEDVTITGLGLMPRPFFRRSLRICRRHDAMGNLPVLRWFAYRYLIEATKRQPRPRASASR